MTDFDLLDNEVERDLRLAVGALLSDRCDHKATAELYDGAQFTTEGLWESLAYEMGLAAVLVPSERGGAGGSAREAALVMEELGPWAPPVPFLTTPSIPTTTLLNTDT